MHKPADPGPPPGSEMDYIVDMLSDLADLASSYGEKSLAVSIRLAALQASQTRCLIKPGPTSRTAP